MRTGNPAFASARLASPMLASPKWKIEAASTALAWPAFTPSTRWIQRTDAARRDHRNGHGIGDGPCQRDVIALLGAVAVHGGEQDFAGPARDNFARILDGIEAGGRAPAVGEDLPSAGRGRFGVDGDDDALAAEFLRRAGDKAAIVHGGCHDRGLVGAGEQRDRGCLPACARRRRRSAA